MLEYKILCETSPTGLQSFTDHVNEYIADGWEPLGGIQVVVAGEYRYKQFYQTMIRDTQNTRAMVRRLREAQKDEGFGTVQWYKDELARLVDPDLVDPDLVDPDVEEES